MAHELDRENVEPIKIVPTWFRLWNSGAFKKINSIDKFVLCHIPVINLLDKALSSVTIIITPNVD